MILDLYADPHLPRKMVQDVVKHFENMIKHFILPCLKTEIEKIIKSGKNEVDILKEVDDCFLSYSKILDDVNTEKKRFTTLKKKGFRMPEEFLLGSVYEEVDIDLETSYLKSVKKYGVYVPLKYSLKMFLEIPGMLSTIFNYVTELKEKSHFMKNFMQGSIWNSNFANSQNTNQLTNNNKITLPLMIYFDEFVAGSALGANATATKFGAVYASIICLPPYIASKLSSILFSTLIKAKDLADLGSKKVFSTLVADLNSLSSKGIKVLHDGVLKIIYFQCVMITGDNLGLNSIFEMVTCFRSDYCCRICRVTQAQIKNMVEEDQDLLRNEENYKMDVNEDDSATTGIFKGTIFNSITGYHICKNFTVDFMHDVMEGCAGYVMSEIVNYYVTQRYFTLPFLNNLLKNFDFGDDNTPPEIKVDKKTKKIKLKMSAAQMKNFVHFFGCIIGDRIQKFSQKDQDFWDMYVNLKMIIMLACLPKITSGTAIQLKDHIKQLNILYIKYFKYLKPKFHHLIHYPAILLKNGPLIKFWCMRNESRHTELKAESNAISGNQNAVKTIAIKEVLRMCHQFHSYQIPNDIIYGANDNDLCSSNIISSMNKTLLSNGQFYRQLTILGEEFKIGSKIVFDVDSIEKVFGKIVKIICYNDDVYFTCEIYKEVYFDNNTQTYLVKKKKNCKTILFNDLPDCTPCVMHTILGKLYVSPETII